MGGAGRICRFSGPGVQVVSYFIIDLLSSLYMFLQTLFTTLSDIVAHSPRINVDSAKQQAQKFVDAIEQKYWELVERPRSQTEMSVSVVNFVTFVALISFPLSVMVSCQDLANV